MPSKAKFQSTRPRGARPSAIADVGWAEKFQSTRPRGARPSRASWPRWAGRVSIHAPAWGATRDLEIEQEGRAFQSTRPRGARRVDREDQRV